MSNLNKIIMEITTRRYGYQLLFPDGRYIPGSYRSVEEMLAVIKERGDVGKVCCNSYTYERWGICSRGRVDIWPIEEIKELKQTSYQIVMPRLEIESEEILAFSDSLVRLKETRKAEGLFETTKVFDKEGNLLRTQTAYLLSGETFSSEHLLQKTAQLKEQAIFIQKFNANLKDKVSQCLITPSGVVGFTGKRVRPLNTYYKV